MTTTTANGLRFPRFPSSKFSVPVVPAGLVSRPRLLDRLDSGRRARLTLVVGSPGAGKTVVLGDWVASRPERSTAWVNCDVADADPVRFLAAIVQAVRRGYGLPDIGEDALQLLTFDGDASADVMAALADDIEGLDGEPLLVIDDLHVTGGAGAQALGLLLEYRPLSLQVAVATRTDPPLRLHRMRTNQELVELRDNSLAFTVEESEAFFSTFGLHLAADDLALVQQRSEGWAAGLQMAALSIQSSPDPGSAAGRLELQRHTVAGYFLDEVLYRQRPEVADFMLATSVLDELSVPACAALYGPEAPDLLQSVYSGHMFVMVLDEGAGTYRYHPLIKDVLQAELHRRDPGREQQLHEAAAQYATTAGGVGRAARHLLAAGDPAAAFRLLNEMVIEDFARNPTRASPLDLDEVQPEMFSGRPEILVPLATELLLRGAFERGERAFKLADQAAVDYEQQPELTVRLVFLKALYMQMIGDLDASVAHCADARRLAEGVVDDEYLLRGLDAVEMYDRTYSFEFSRARALADAVAAAVVSPPPVRDVLCQGLKSQAAFFEGSIRDAASLAEGALASAGRLGIRDQYFAFAATRTSAMLALERRDLPTATRINEGILGRQAIGRPAFDYFAQLDRARIWAVSGDVDQALGSLPGARAALRTEQSPLLAEADELEARFRLALGDRSGAANVAERLPDDRRCLIGAAVALAANDPQKAAAALSRAPHVGATTRSDLELRLLRAATALAESSRHAAQLVREALGLADRHGYLQTVLDTAPLVVDHLISGLATYPDAVYVSELTAAGVQDRKRRASSPAGTALTGPLTNAERRVLEKLPQRLTYVDMALELHLSLNTVKTHLRHTYMNLGVDSRTSAVKRATSLGLL
jgi:LuxR family transcriptional regulator, maltose regulon positive regulatory protein